jgi:hypothetical protein
MKKILFIVFLAVTIIAVAAWQNRLQIEKYYYGWKIGQLRSAVLAQERRQIRNIPAHQILSELEWVAGKTRDYPRVLERIKALEIALHDPRNFTAEDEQSPVDGSWGQWYIEWVFKLIATYDHVGGPARTPEPPKFPVRILDRINSPEKLAAHLNSLLISNPTVDGFDHRWELNETLSALIRLILRGQPANYPYHPELKAALLDWIMNTGRNPETGYWGEHYLRKGKLTKTNDISITFHIVSYLNGEVPDWSKIIDTTLAIKGVKYGWMTSNHDHVGAVELFLLGWPHASPTQRQAIRNEIQQMLDWCLRDSLKPDGSFTVDQDSIETSTYFGASFLARIGYFDRTRRFWTDQEFPRAPQDREHIINFIRSHLASGGAGGSFYRGALAQLGADAVRQEHDVSSPRLGR